MKRVDVVVEREEMNSTTFDGVREWGSAGCSGKGRRSVSGSMSRGEASAGKNRTESTARLGHLRDPRSLECGHPVQSSNFT